MDALHRGWRVLRVLLVLLLLSVPVAASEFAGLYTGSGSGSAAHDWHMEIYGGGALYLVEHTAYERFYGWVDESGAFIAEGTRQGILVGTVSAAGTISGEWITSAGARQGFTGIRNERYVLD